ncbi:Uncharacterized protein KIAA1143-like protein [Trichoplax sp. H2]|nr:Uncharacterized protein KIAA1143-like protein [Trichoplax sp. H2]|eukprot:RDD47605.1 Uncharacterized protein KIAA1143-like protein [Trichoplax sp. H2]
MAGRGRRSDVNYIKPQVPKFIQKFKDKVNYVDEPTINTKKNIPTLEDLQDEIDREDEQPVVVFDPKEVTCDEADRFKEQLSQKRQHDDEEHESTSEVSGTKHVFKKRAKSSENSNERNNSKFSTKSSASSDGKSKKSDMKSVKNTKLLSFDDEGLEE